MARSEAVSLQVVQLADLRRATYTHMVAHIGPLRLVLDSYSASYYYLSSRIHVGWVLSYEGFSGRPDLSNRFSRGDVTKLRQY